MLRNSNTIYYSLCALSRNCYKHLCLCNKLIHPTSGRKHKNKHQFSCSVVSNSLQPHGLQHARLPCPSPTPWTCYFRRILVMPSNHFILCRPLLAFNLPQHQGLFQWVGSLHQVAEVLELQHQSFQCIFRVDFLVAVYSKALELFCKSLAPCYSLCLDWSFPMKFYSFTSF